MVICNATPLINFAVVNRLDILSVTFNQIIIPEAVYRETAETGFPGSPCVEQAIAAKWLLVRSISTAGAFLELDEGEREAIALALEIGCQRILLDEREARQVALKLGLSVIGTLGILLLAKKQQTITQIKPLLDEMRKTAQYWVSNALYQQILQQAGEL